MNLAVSLAKPTMFSFIYSFWLIWNIFIYVHVLCYINIYKVLWYVLSYYLHTCSYNLCSERFGYVAMYSDCIAREVVDLLLTRSCCVYQSRYVILLESYTYHNLAIISNHLHFAEALPDTLLKSRADSTSKKYLGAFKQWKWWATEHKLKILTLLKVAILLYF